MKKLLVFFLLLALVLSGCSVSCPAESPSNPEALGELKVHFIDVIHGDSTLVECNGKYMLIDAGESYAGGTVLLYLANQGVEKLDVVVSIILYFRKILRLCHFFIGGNFYFFY